MKVLYLITRAERGGAQVHVLDLIRGLRPHCEIEVAAGEDGFLLKEARQLGAACHVLPHLVQPVSPARDALAVRDIVRLLRRVRPTIVHAHTSKAGILGRFGAWLCNVPAVFTAHTWCFAEGTSWRWKLLGACEQLAALSGGMIINVSDANRALALRYRVAPPAQLCTIHNGVPDESWDGLSVPAQEPVIVMVARFVPQKNHALLLEACAALQSSYRLQFAGTGPTRPDIERRVDELGLRDRVEFLGDRSDIGLLLRKASIFALATNWEGFPLSILEAMRAGLPVVASDVGGVREAVVAGRNGFLIARQDAAAFGRALETLLSDEKLRLRMASNSRRIFEERFTVEQMIQKTINLYRQVASSPVREFQASQVSQKV